MALFDFSSPHGNIEFSSAAVAFDWCFSPSRQCQTTDGSNDETPLVSPSSPVTILPASRRCPSTGIPPWILDLCPVCLHAGAFLFLHHSHFARTRPFSAIALSAGTFPFCSRAAIRCHRAERWGIHILLERGHLLPSR